MDYFADLFGDAELTRREHWDGKEEPIYLILGDAHISREDLQKEHTQQWNTRKARHRPGQAPEVTLDIDHEVID